MRILLVDVNARYINDTRNLFPRLLDQVGTLSIFGPGYTPSEILKKGLTAFFNDNGGFDVVIVTEHVLFCTESSSKLLGKLYKHNYVTNFPMSDLAGLYKIPKELNNLYCLKVASLLETDYYNIDKAQLDVLETSSDLIICWGNQFILPIQSLPLLALESFSHKATDLWFNYSRNNRSKLIPLMHYVADEEFDYSPIALRRFDWAVPGSLYASRKSALKILKDARVSLARIRHNKVGTILSKLRFSPYSSSLFQAYLKEAFKSQIRQSRFVYTCGSGLGWPIRKFFEIPALGAILVCQPCTDIKSLGFIEGVNFVASDPDKLLDFQKKLKADLHSAQSIANAGRMLIGRRHTISARAKQLNVALDLAIKGEWFGSIWDNGEWVIDKSHPKKIEL